jgi:hypothetical protein
VTTPLPEGAALTGSSAESWASSILAALGAPQTAANVSSLTGWFAREGGGGANNPLNTTLPTAGSTGSINSAGVQSYGTPAEGITATVDTLEGSGYSAIVSALKSGQGLIGSTSAAVSQELSTWSGGGYSSVGSGGGSTPGTVASGTGSSTPASTIAAGTSGNPMTDALEWIGNLVNLVPGLSGIATVLSDGASAVADVNHDLAYALDTAVTMFKPGQAWRIAFTAVTIGCAAGAVVVYRSGGQEKLPMAIAITGAGLLSGYMAFRPWPAPSGKPIKPGAYAFEILEGQVPAQGPPALSPSEVQATEYALGTFEAIWAVAKLSSVVKNVAQTLYDGVEAGLGAFSAILGAFGAGAGAAAGGAGGGESGGGEGEGGSGGEGGEPVVELPPLE